MEHAGTLGETHAAHDNAAASAGASTGKSWNLRAIDWIWNIRGSVRLPAGLSSDEAYMRLGPLIEQPGTTYERIGDALTFTKKDQAAQDKMSIFDAGVLQVEQSSAGPVLRFRMASRALLFCFLAPLLFLAFGQMIVGIGMLDGPASEAEDKAKKDEKKDEVRKLNPIDEFLGAPAPEKPKKDDNDKKKESKHSPTAAYVFAGIFAALYIVGRLLEDWLIKKRLREALHAG